MHWSTVATHHTETGDVETDIASGLDVGADTFGATQGPVVGGPVVPLHRPAPSMLSQIGVAVGTAYLFLAMVGSGIMQHFRQSTPAPRRR